MNRESTVYIVEDDHSMRGALALLLEGEGYRTEQYGSAEEFLSAADEPELRAYHEQLIAARTAATMRCCRASTVAIMDFTFARAAAGSL